jgi:hypothetical protein
VVGDMNGLLSVVDGDTAKACSLSAVVGAALVCGANAGTRPTENLDVVDSREAREAGRRGDDADTAGIILLRVAFRGGESTGRLGEGGGGGEVGGEEGLRISGVVSDALLSARILLLSIEVVLLSAGTSGAGEACARRRESELDGRALGELFARARVGNRCELGGCVTSKVSSTSASGGAGGRADGLNLPVAWNASLVSLSLSAFFPDTLRLLLCVGCVQSSTSSM